MNTYLFQIRWAFKESLVKASGRKDLIFSSMYLEKDIITRKPTVKLIQPNDKILIEELNIKDIQISISHENEYSIAFVILLY